MASHVVHDVQHGADGGEHPDAHTGAPSEEQGPASPDARPRHRLRRVLIGIAVLVVVLLAAGAAWFVFGREQAEQLTDDQALEEFRAASRGEVEALGRPAVGVYPATASGTESIGIPGFDEELGPNAPMTLTYSDDGCFTTRVDFNSHHWRSWNYCPSPTATFALVGIESWTQRKAPGLDLSTLSTYSCDQPLDVLWADPAAGETRTGSCTGVSDLDGAVTGDRATTEVLGTDTIEIDGRRVEVVNVRTTDEFSEAQTGTEVGTWWFDAATGLPVRFTVDASLSGGSGDYREDFEVELTSLTPAT